MINSLPRQYLYFGENGVNPSVALMWENRGGEHESRTLCQSPRHLKNCSREIYIRILFYSYQVVDRKQRLRLDINVLDCATLGTHQLKCFK